MYLQYEQRVIKFDQFVQRFQYNQSQSMQTEKDDWQGFESFSQEKITLANIPVIQLISTQPPPEVEKIVINVNKVPAHKKIINFKSNNRRKFSFVQFENTKKLPEKKQITSQKTEKKQMSFYIQRPYKRQGTLQSKEDSIPIFRFPNNNQAGKIIYRGFLPAAAHQYFSAFENDQLRGSWQTVQSQSPQTNQDEAIFDSKFQSGNLESVRKIGNEYHLFIAPDTNTKGHRQWFFFTVSSFKNKKMKLIIHNFKKRFSLFQTGMKPFGKKIQDSNDCWKPIGFNIKYYRQQNRGTESKLRTPNKNSPNYNLSFELELQANETYSIASSIPYTYSFLKSQLNEFQMNNSSIISCEQTILCKTLSGLDLPLITINGSIQNESIDKIYIIINARIHPGETSSSWVVDGMLEELMSSIRAQKIIKESRLVIKIIPMLNPDGVYMGNYRTGILGIDFNRLFLTGKPDLFPEIQALRSLVKGCKSDGKVDLYLDLHGHSILPGCFLYGPDPVFSPQSNLKGIESQLEHSKYFAKKHCTEGVNNLKSQTSRIFFQIQEGIYSLTCQNSLGLYYKDEEKTIKEQFEAKDWKNFGRQFINKILCIYELQLQNESDLPFQKFISIKSARNKQFQIQQEEMEWKKSKTDADNFAAQISKMQQINSDNIQVLKPKMQKTENNFQQIDSLNDSDNDSQDLSPQKHKQLFNIVKRVVEKRKNLEQSAFNQTKKQQFRSRSKKNQERGQMYMNFKQYRFGVQDSTLADWFTKKRLLSIPRALKTQKINQSYIIRKAVPKQIPNEIVFQSMEVTRKIKTEEREQGRKRFNSKMNNYNSPMQFTRDRF